MDYTCVHQRTMIFSCLTLILLLVSVDIFDIEAAGDNGKESEVSEEELEDSGQKETVVHQSRDLATACITLLRAERSYLKGDPPLKPEVKDLDGPSMSILLRHGRSDPFIRVSPIPARMDDPGFLWDSTWYSPEVPTILIMHDRCVTGTHSSIQDITTAFMNRNFFYNFNLFTMDTKGFACASVDFVLRRLSRMGDDYNNARRQIAKFFEIGIEKGKIRPDQINLLGIGLSAQLAGDVAITLNRKIKSVVGVEPYKYKKYPSVKPEHAEILQLYHATVVNDPSKYKFMREGRADFYLTVSESLTFSQTSCKNPELCLKLVCLESFLGVILTPSRFLAWKCNSMADFKKQKPECNSNVVSMTYPPTVTPQGLYFLRVTANYPHGVGEDGKSFDPDTVAKNKYRPAWADASWTIDNDNRNQDYSGSHVAVELSEERS